MTKKKWPLGVWIGLTLLGTFILYFGTFTFFVLHGHREHNLGGYGYVYIGPKHMETEKALAVFYAPAYNLAISLGIDISYLNVALPMERPLK
jgi:hypothetical protein